MVNDVSKLKYSLLFGYDIAGEYFCVSLQRVGHSSDSIIAFCSAFLERYPTAAWCLDECGKCDYNSG